MESEYIFSNRDLKNLIVPLFIEQLLVAMVGIADVFIVGFAGEAAVSGVSLVNSFNNIFIYLFTALAAGGAVVISQYIGCARADNAKEAASQLLTASTLFSLIIGAFVLIFNEKLMHLMFGKTDADVMNACVTYLRIWRIPIRQLQSTMPARRCTAVLAKRVQPCIFRFYQIS